MPVKRLFASLILVLFLLNVLGYYGIYSGLISKSADELTNRIEDDSDAVGATMTFKVPITIPYAVDSREYEPINTQYVFEGKVFQLVKQKLVKDTLYLVAVQDVQSSMWSKALAEYVMSFGDTQQDTKDMSSAQGFIKDFVSLSISLGAQTAGWVLFTEPSFSVTNIIGTFSASVVHPPERA
jgi:hypothetical protein